MIKIVQRNDTNFTKTINEVIEAELYRDFFLDLFIYYTDEIKSLSVIYDEDPVAVAVVWNYPPNYNIGGEHIGVYVEEAYRGLGLGRQAVEALGGIKDRNWLLGDDNSGEFWINVQSTEK
jgi:RimJ/RimL family protein N-acetyltransferase